MAQTNYTPIQLYYSTTAAAVPVNTNLLNGELAINITDGKLYYKDNSGTVQVIATKGAGTIGGSTTQIQYNNAGALAGSSDMTYTSATNTVLLTKLNLTNALGATYGGTGLASYTVGDLLYADTTTSLAKLALGTANYILTVNSGGTGVQWSAPSAISVSTATNLAGGVAGSVPYQSGASTTTFLGIGAANRVMTSSGSAPQWVTALTGLTGVSSSSITNTSLTSTRVVYSGASGVQTDSANLTFNGTTLSAGGFSTTGLSTLVKTVTVGNSNFDGGNAFAPATPAKLYIGTGTVTDMTTPINGNVTTGAITSLAITPIAADKTGVTYTNAATLYIDGAPSNGTNITITNPYALYIAAGNVYLGGGTANGVAYLNTNKVLTTGSALTFDGSNLSVVGTYAINQTNLFEINNGQSGATKFASGVSLTSDSGGNYTSAFYVASGSNTRYNLITGTPTDLLFYSANTEAMRLTSTSLYTASTINVGIGVSSLTYKFQVNGTINTAYSSTNTLGGGTLAYISNASTTNGTDATIRFDALGSASPAAASISGVHTGDGQSALTFGTRPNGSSSVLERARIDSSGQLKLQTGALQVFGALDAGQISAAVMDWQPATNNARFLSYGPSGTSGGFSWTTVIGGGAGTQAMTLDASGNLGIVTTSPASFFSSADNLVVGTTTGSNGVTILGGSTATAVLAFGYTTGTSAGDASNRAKIWYDGTSDTLRMSSGGSLMNATQFVLDASGNLLVGTTNSSGTVGAGFKVLGGRPVTVNAASTDGTTIYEAYSTGAAAYRFYVGMGGTIFATSIVITAISDERLKENVRDIETGLDAIMALKPRRFDWKEGKGQDKKNVAGFIAQEFEDVFPECVSTSMAGADGIEYKNINHETLIPTLVKAIQELKAEFDAYKASHP